MEAKLQEYRRLRRRKELIERTKAKLASSKEKLINFLVPSVFRDMGVERNEDEVLLMEEEEPPKRFQPLQTEYPNDIASETSELESFEEESNESWRYYIIKWSLIAIIWLSLYIYFLQLQFGAVFFVISLLVGIYLNTRTRPKKKGEVSAYSVFNEDCVSIDGTLKAEELQRQMLYGMGGMNML
ncbi:hypothetical protein O3G_MSEX009126 [Manduca sexta]|uniref:SAYSvFN domain-containing protein n=1 Tax=Manduca sexta TaxID=7130 RepID=A0A922CR03_MANSE|nr:hypothetical protein O3G_MSEX009126 [Manduca sexta]